MKKPDLQKRPGFFIARGPLTMTSAHAGHSVQPASAIRRQAG